MTNIQLHTKAIALLQQLIATPSFSKEEQATAAIIKSFLQQENVIAHEFLNNVWAVNKYAKANKPTLLLNSHHDTVKPNKGYTNNPFEPTMLDDKLYGLGSNDAGGCLVSLLSTFIHFYNQENLPFNIVIAATAEEEISGSNGVEALLQHDLFLQTCFVNESGFVNWTAIVGEPTLLQLAIAERGLMVLDIEVEGVAGHAARQEGVNAIYKTIPIIEWFKNYKFDKVSNLLGSNQTTITAIHTDNKQHNVIPSQCSCIVDVRVNELYSFEDVLSIIKSNISAKVVARSCRLKSSIIPVEHSLVQAGIQLGKTFYGSPTTSDKALMPFPALKMGPGDSARSHTANEFIFVKEIEQGIDTYISLLEMYANSFPV
jgi:acetylornithine deacetylase